MMYRDVSGSVPCIIRDTREVEYIGKTIKEGIKWRFDVFF